MNALLATVGLGSSADRLARRSERTALLALALTFVWSMIGTNTIIFLTGMATLDPRWLRGRARGRRRAGRSFSRITAAAAEAVHPVCLVMTLISAFTALFSLIFVMTSGGPGYGSTTLEFFVYQTAFETGRFGTGRDATASSCLRSWRASVSPRCCC